MPEPEVGSADASRISRLEDLVERRLAALNVDSGNWTAPQIKEYIQSILDEKDRALEMASDEREKAASALRSDQQRALDQAEREREKAATALRDQLTERIAQGDNNLREHIVSQISQLRMMVENAERDAVTRQEGLRREMKIQHDSDQAAIQKAEASNEARFAAANEWRGQSADRERTQQEQIASFVATLTPLAKSEAVEDKLATSIERNRADIENLTKRFELQQGQAIGVKEQVTEQRGAGTEQRSQATLIMGIVLGIVTIIMAGVTIFALNQDPAPAPSSSPAMTYTTNPRTSVTLSEGEVV